MSDNRVLTIEMLRDLVGDDKTVVELLEGAAGINAPLLLELHEAGEKQAWETVRSRAHNLKGAYANLGALELADLCSQLEVAGRLSDAVAMRRYLPLLPGAIGRLAHEVSGFAVMMRSGRALGASVRGR